MSKKKKNAIQPSREENYAEWYQQVIKAADLAEHSSVRGCMVIKPWGFRIWENIKRILDQMFEDTGHENAYFPLLIPLNYLEKEAEHVEGFAKECAVVTHHRLEKNEEGRLVPSGKLEEPFVIRPTSEMIIGETFSKWVDSYRDLPLLINQWANVMRWEMRTRLFLRTSEFLWQEGHTVHATKNEALEESLRMLEVYRKFCHDFLAVPVICGTKTESEKFPGAVTTFTIEAMMQDRKALQAGTSHFLGQNFAKSCNIRFRDEESNLQYGWMTSWGVTTRLIGGMIMTHSDDDGLIMPPRVASAHVVIIPFIHSEEARSVVMDYAESLVKDLEKLDYCGKKLRVIIDDRDLRGGEKNWSWIKKGVPLRIEIGPKEVENEMLSICRRDKEHRDKSAEKRSAFPSQVLTILEEIQANIYKKAVDFQNENIVKINSRDDFYAFFKKQGGGFALAHYHQDPKVEEKLQKDLNVTARCIPLDESDEKGKCIFSGKETDRRTIFSKAY